MVTASACGTSVSIRERTVEAGSALGDERLRQFHEERQDQHEGEDQQRHQERRDDAADDVAVEDSEHTLVATRYHTPGERHGGGRCARGTNSSSTGGVMARIVINV